MDNGEQQYFSPNEPVVPVQPWWRHRRTWLLTAAAVLGIAIITSIVVFAINSIRQNVPPGEAEVLDRITAATAACATEEDVATCETKMRSDMARAAATPLACADLPEDARTNCIMLIAQDSGDMRVCVALPSNMQQKCNDEIRFSEARRTGDYAACEDIGDDTVRAACQAYLRSTVLMNGTCVENDIPVDECARAAALRSVTESGSYADCMTLVEEDVVLCQGVFAGLDQDGDGFSAKKEYEIGTDPRNADTDGDGYSDAEEVKSGNNPTQ